MKRSLVLWISIALLIIGISMWECQVSANLLIQYKTFAQIKSLQMLFTGYCLMAVGLISLAMASALSPKMITVRTNSN